MSISRDKLLTLQAYSLSRRAQRQQMIRHRRQRSLTLGPCMRLQFEDELTVRYQIQEVLHAERCGHPDAVEHEIGTYAHLVPDGSNWKATLQIEIPDALERSRELPRLNEAAHRLYVEVGRQPRVFALANEDLPDGHRSRPSAVHFLRFQFAESLRAALHAGAAVTLGCAHDQYAFRRVVPADTVARLCRDLVLPTHKLDLCAVR
ncbi:DUF3501 family protein [Piscinibacter sp.]|uniref:DUF3501 family protein n=1 Tax=Piscinibacter sp. TaxID=1903157 RepID=UPI0039E66BAF